MKIVVIGSGAWGSAISLLLHKKFEGTGDSIFLLFRSLSRLRVLKSDRHTNYPVDIVTADTAILKDADFIILAVPTIYLRETALRLRRYIYDKPILNASKGIEEGFRFAHDILNDTLGIPLNNFCQLSGPNFAAEVMKFLPTASVAASSNEKLASLSQTILSCPSFRIYRSFDPIGVELAGALKNIYAIASGVSDGLKLGNNGRAALLSRSLAEMKRMGKLFNMKQETLLGLAGVGDLFLTATSSLSRNYSAGIAISEGRKTVPGRSVAEGVWSAKAVADFSKLHHIYLPIADAVYKLIYENKKPYDMVINLMNRPLKRED